MADEFVNLAKSTEPDLNKYLNALNSYLQERYSDQLKKESLWKKITKNMGSKWNFTTFYDKALKKSRKEQCKTILAYIDLLKETKNVDDQWINNKEIKEAIENIELRIQNEKKAKITELDNSKKNLQQLIEKKIISINNATNEIHSAGNNLSKLEDKLTKAKLVIKNIKQNITRLNS